MRVRQQLLGAALLASLSTGAVWAQNAGEDVKQGAENVGQGMKQGAERTGEAVKQGGQQAGEAMGGHRAEREGKKLSKAHEEKQATINDLAMYDQQVVALGRLAEERSNNPAVKQFARQLVQSHRRNLDSLQSYAQREQLALNIVDLSKEGTAVGGGGMVGTGEREMQGEQQAPGKEARKMEAKEQKQVDRFIKERDKLASKSGKDFDRDFLGKVRDINKDQTRAVGEAQKKYRNDAALSQALSQAQPTLKQNEQQLKQVEQQVKRQG